MFVLKSKYKKLKSAYELTKNELEVTKETRRKYANALHKFVPWFLKHDCCEATQPETDYYFQLYGSYLQEYSFTLCSSGNNKVIMNSEGYDSRRNALEAIERLMERLGSSLKPVIYDSNMNRIN